MYTPYDPLIRYELTFDNGDGSPVESCGSLGKYDF